MTKDKLIETLSGLLTVNQKEAEAVKEAIEIITNAGWCDPEYELPPDTNFVLALISGRIGNGTYDHAPAIVEYWEGEGWYLTEIDYNEQKDYWRVDAWMPIVEYEEAEE